MAKCYLLGDSKGIPFAAFSSMKALFQYVDCNWHLMIGAIREDRQEAAEHLFKHDEFKEWPTVASMVADSKPYHFEGSSIVGSELGTVAKRFRGEPSAKLCMQDSTGTLTWTIKMLTMIPAKR